MFFLKTVLKRLVRFVDTRRAYKFYLKQWMTLTDLKQATQVVNSMRFSQQINLVELDQPRGRSIVVIAPHPDDEVIGPGGTLLKAADSGARIHVIYLTSDPQEELIEIHEKEALAAVKDMAAEVEFLRWSVGAIPIDETAIKRLGNAISQYQPDTIMVSFCLDDHDDHRRASELLMRVFDFQLLKAEIEVWAYQVYSVVLPNVVVDITNVVERKEASIASYSSQYVSRNWAHYALGLNAWNCRHLKARGDRKSYAELFMVLPLRDYTDLCRKYFSESSDCYYGSAYRSETLYETNSKDPLL